MSHENNSASKRSLRVSIVSLLAATILTSSVLSGCFWDSDDKGDTAQTEIITETQVVTKVVNGVYTDEDGNVITENGEQSTSENTTDAPAATNKSSDAQNSSDNSGGVSNNNTSTNTGNSGNSGNSNKPNKTSNASSSNKTSNSGSSNKTDKPGNSGSSGQTSSQTPQTTKPPRKPVSSDSSKFLKVDGEKYNVGDTIYCTYFLYVPVDMLNFQGTLTYNGTYLKVKKANLIAPASYGGILNYNLDQKIKFNGTMLNGYNYTEPGDNFLYVEYEVLKAGTTSTNISFEVLNDIDNKSYASGGKLTNGATIKPIYE